MNPDAVQSFRRQFGREPTLKVFSPGRINLIGEHTDYNDGLVMPVAVHLGTNFYAADNAAGVVRVHSMLMDDSVTIPLDRPALLEPVGGWQDYFTGVVSGFLRLPCAPAGLDILVDSTLPIGSGLSSSASVTTGMAAVLNDEWGAGQSRLELALIARRSENEFAGLACGILDPFAVAMSKSGHAIVLDCGTLAWRTIPFPDQQLAIMTVDSGVPRRLVDSGYNARRQECERALALVAGERPVASLSELRESDLAGLEKLRRDDVAFRRARHVVTENARVNAAAGALEKDDLEGLGRAMYESHRSLSEDYEVSCPELDSIVALAKQLPGVVGAKMTGAGFGGSVVILVDVSRVSEVSETLPESYAAATGLEATVTVCQLSGGVKRVV